jgi:hypothetical protein
VAGPRGTPPFRGISVTTTRALCHHRSVIRAELGLGILGTALWVYCLLDVIMTDESRIRNLSKGTWVFIVLVTSVVGSVAWLVAGRPEGPARGLPYKGNTGRPTSAYPEYDRPGRFVATSPDDDEAFLRQVRERAESQLAEAKRQRAERERLEREAVERERKARRAREAAEKRTEHPEPEDEAPAS